GKSATSTAVSRLSDEPEHPDVDARLLSLVRRDFLAPRPGREDAYRFRHVLLRNEAHAGRPKTQRSQLPEGFANLAERTNAGRAGELDEIIGYPLEQAFRYRAELGPLSEDARALGRRACDILTTAGRRATGRGDSPAAANLLERALRLEPGVDGVRLEIMIELSEALQGTGALGEAQRVLDEAAPGGEAAGA